MAGTATVRGTGGVNAATTQASVQATGVTVAAGSGILAIVASNGQFNLGVPTDNAGNSYVSIGGASSNSVGFTCYYAKNARALNSGTVTAAWPTGYGATRATILVLEVTGSDATLNAFAGSGQAVGLATDPNNSHNGPSSGGVTPVYANDLEIGVVTGDEYVGGSTTGATLTLGSLPAGWTQLTAVEHHSTASVNNGSLTTFVLTKGGVTTTQAISGQFSTAVSYWAAITLRVQASDVAPGAPTLTAKGTFDRKQSTTFAWTFSDPDALDTQSAYELLITRHDTGATVYDSGKVLSTAQTATLPANSLPMGGIQYDWTVKTWDNHGTAGPYAATAAVTPYSSPDAPTLSATGDFNIAQAHTFGWQYNDADAGNTESAYQLTIARVSDGALVFDTGKKVSTANTYTLVAGTLPAGARYQWTVRTWDQHDIAGPAAVAQQFTAAGPPTATITQPTAGAVVTQSALTVVWTYGGLLPQGAYQLRLLQGGVAIYNSGQVLGTVTQAALPALSDASSYQVGVTVWDQTNVAGPETLVSFSTAFVATPTPFIQAVPAADGSSIALIASAPAPGGGQVPAQTFEIWRSNDNGLSWIRVAANLPPT